MTNEVVLYLRHEAAATWLATHTVLTYDQAHRVLALLGGRCTVKQRDHLTALAEIVNCGDTEERLTRLIQAGYVSREE